MALMRAERCPPALAEKAILMVMTAFPDRKIADGKGYAAQLMAVFMAYPAAMVSRAMHPAHGICSQLEFFPSVGKVSTYLKAMMTRLENLESLALREAARKRPGPPPEPDPKAGTTAESRAEVVRRALGYVPGPKPERIGPTPKKGLLSLGEILGEGLDIPPAPE